MTALRISRVLLTATFTASALATGGCVVEHNDRPAVVHETTAVPVPVAPDTSTTTTTVQHY